MSAKQIFLFISGWISLSLGVIGVILPLLPTTPFVLLSAFCFARSNKRFHNWLLEHKLFGDMIKSYQAGLGLTKKIKIRAISMLWLSMMLSAYIVGKPWVVMVLMVTGICVTIYLIRLPTYQKHPVSASV